MLLFILTLRRYWSGRTEGKDHLKIFVDYLNNNYPNLPVLACTAKPTDKHQHLLSSSCHPQHTKKAVPFSLALRIRRSTDAKFPLRLNELRTAYWYLLVMISLSLAHSSNELLVVLSLTLYTLTVTIPWTAYLLLLRITYCFHTFISNYVYVGGSY